MPLNSIGKSRGQPFATDSSASCNEEEFYNSRERNIKKKDQRKFANKNCDICGRNNHTEKYCFKLSRENAATVKGKGTMQRSLNRIAGNL